MSCFSEGSVAQSRCPSAGLGLQLGLVSSPCSCGLFPLPSECLARSAGSERPSVCAVGVDFVFFLFFLKSRLLLQVLTQENLATALTGVMVPAGAVTQPLLIPIGIAGQVAGQQGLAVWTIPTATVAALPGLTAASPTGGIFKPPLAGLQGNGNSPQDCTRLPTTLHYHPCTCACHVGLQTRGPPRATALESGSGVPGTQPQSCCTTLGL